MAIGDLRKTTRSRSSRWALLLSAGALAFLIYGQSTAQNESTEAQLLSIGAASSSELLESGEPITYEFDAVEGATYLIQLDQFDLDFVITLWSPDGTERTFNSPLFRDESDYALIEDALAGMYLLVIESDEATHARGWHTIGVSELNSAGSDPMRVAALRVMSEAAATTAESVAASTPEHGRELARDALDMYLAASEAWRDLEEDRLQAQALYSAGMLQYWSLYDNIGATELAPLAAQIYRRLNEEALYANCLFLEAYSLIEVANDPGFDADLTLDRALELFTESYAIHERLGNTYELAMIANDMGLAYQRLGDFESAENYWRSAEQFYSSLAEWRGSFLAQQNLAFMKIDEGYAAEAAQTLQGILDQLGPNTELSLQGVVLNNLGAAYREAGRFDEALESYSAAHDIVQNINAQEIDADGERAYALRGIGSTYFALGELDLSQDYLQRAKDLSREIGESRQLAFSLAYLGNIAYFRGDYQTALTLHQSAVEATDSPQDRAYREIFVARDLIALGRIPDAISSAGSALETAQNESVQVTQADALVELGRASLAGEDAGEAAEHLSNALEIYDRLDLANGQADALNGLALAAYAQGDLNSALSYAKDSVNRFEQQRQRVIAPELRAFYSAARRGYYETQIRLLMAAYDASDSTNDQYLYDALSISERSRARLTIDLISEAAIDLRQGMPEELLDRQDDLYDELLALRYQRDRLLDSTDSGDELIDSLNVLRAGMSAVENELNLLETELRLSNPRYTRFTSDGVLTGEEIQSSLSDDAVLLQYDLGKQASYAWIVTTNSISRVVLANREAIESAARAAFENLRSYDPSAAGRLRLDDDLEALSDLILAPVMESLDPARQKILVVVDGALQYIPFAALPIEDDEGRVPLIEVQEIIGLPSVSALAVQRSRERESVPQHALAVFADPVFEPTDPRLVARQATARVSLVSEGSLLARSSVSRNLVRLAATADEGTMIANLVPDDTRYVATGFNASRDTVLTQNLADYRYIHFATHGLIDSRYPALSALAFSQFDDQGTPQDGFLRLPDIYNLELNADLVVLSACETALGREIRGEGLVGLTQGFLYAGAQSLVVSLWQVPDRGTAELMTRFYRYMLEEGLSPAAALRQAQISLARERRWSDPFFWSAFIVVGGAET